MRIFVTGATGFVGSAVVQELLGAGHQVLGLTRSEEGAKALAAAGAEVHRGTLEDLDSLRRGAETADGVIHTAFIHDFSQYQAAGQTDRRAIETIGEVLRGTERPFIVTSGLAGFVNDRPATETDRRDPNVPAPPRVSEETALALAEQGLRASVIRLASSVHDRGDHGFVPYLINLARAKGVSAYVGDGQNHWSAVHRLDAARLYRLAVEKGATGAVYHGVGEPGITIRDLATTIGQHLGVPVVSIAPEEAASHFDWMGRFITLNLQGTNALTQEWLGWQPTHPTLLADLAEGHYFGS